MATSFRYEYDSLVEVNVGNQMTKYVYDDNNRVKEIIRNDGLGKEVVIARYQYDSDGNMLKVTDADGRSIYYAYDLVGRLKAVTNPIGHTTEYEYDALGNMTAVKDPEGNTTRYEYDVLQRLVGVVDALNGRTGYTYSAIDNLTSITDANGHVTESAYDLLGQVVVTTDAAGNKMEYEYDLSGNLTAVEYADRDKVSFRYGKDNHLTGIDGDGKNVEFGYDRMGNLTWARDILEDVTVSCSYNEMNRLADVTTTGKVNGYVRYEYDKYGNRVRMTDSNNSATEYYYDGFNQLVRLVNPAGEATIFEYCPSGLLKSRIYANGVRTEYNYDKVGRLAEISSPMGDIGYTYDRVGNRVTMIDHEGTHQYTYDRLYRLSKAMYPDASQAGYTYDGVGNRLTMSRGGGIMHYSYNAANQLLKAGDVGYEYDARGNMIAQADDNDVVRYKYDLENRLVGINYPDGRENKFVYDPLGRRIVKQGNNGVIRYLHDGENVLAEMDEYGEKVRYTGGLEIDNLISMTQSGGNTHFFHQDGLGSTVNLSNSQGNKVSSYGYDIFGSIRSQSGSVHTPFLFTGRELDKESGLYYYRARYYEPEIGRFVQVDPVKYSVINLYPYADSIGISFATGFNFYAYTKNNPINFTDPLGLWYIDINISFGYGIGITGGTLICPGGIYPYAGGGIVSPPGGVSVTWSPSNPIPGWNVGLQGGYWGGGQIGYGFGKGGGSFWEVGFVTPGGSFTGYYVWGPWGDKCK